MPKPPPMSPFDHAEVVRLGAEHRAEQLARAGRRLVLRVERGAAALVHADRAARLHRHRDQALVVQLDLGDVRRARRTPRPLSRHRRSALRRRRCRAPARQSSGAPGSTALRAIDHARQVLVVDHHQLGRVLRLLRASRPRSRPPAGRRSSTLSSASGVRGGAAIGEPSARLKSGGNGMCPTPSARRSAIDHAAMHARRTARSSSRSTRSSRARAASAPATSHAWPRKHAVVAEQALADEQPVVLEALLRARGAEARRRGIELDLQGGSVHSLRQWSEKIREVLKGVRI